MRSISNEIHSNAYSVIPKRNEVVNEIYWISRSGKSILALGINTLKFDDVSICPLEHGKNNFAEGSTILLDINQKIILLKP